MGNDWILKTNLILMKKKKQINCVCENILGNVKSISLVTITRNISYTDIFNRLVVMI